LSGFRTCRSGEDKRRDKSAFTLAEVLITLGIIGVVAAMTIPTLMAKIRRAQYSAAFKKGLSTLNQAVKMNYANYGWDFGGVDTSYFNCWKAWNSGEISSQSLCVMFGETVKGEMMDQYSSGEGYSLEDIIHFSADHVSPYDNNAITEKILVPNSSSGSYLLWRLLDGIIVGLYYPYECTKTRWQSEPTYCLGFIDVNGTSLPNKLLTCEDENKTKSIRDEDYEECTISDKDLGDMIPINFYDQTVIPGTNSARALLNGK
jgi:prepilin-type N-terminal cleavage/methylation domain-containing protein